MQGGPLIERLIGATGLPREMVEPMVQELIASHGRSGAEVTIEDLREMTATLLREVFVQQKNRNQG